MTTEARVAPRLRQLWAVVVLKDGVESVLSITPTTSQAGRLLAGARDMGVRDAYLVCFVRTEEAPR